MDAEQKEFLFIAGGNTKGTATLKDSFIVPYKTKHDFTSWFSIYPPRYLLNSAENLLQTYEKLIFIAAYFIITKNWESPRHPSVSEWIINLHYICTIGYYLTLYRSELLSHEKTWMNFKYILISEKASLTRWYRTWLQLWYSAKGKTIEIGEDQ